MALLKSYRRYCHRMRMNERALGNGQLESVWRSKQEAITGAPLPASIPFLTVLAAAGYTAYQDLDGADVDELIDIAGMNELDAQSVLNAFALLPTPL